MTKKATSRKIMIHRREPMSRQGMKQWSRPLRGSVFPYIFRNLGTFQMPYAVCTDEYVFADWLHEQVGPGYYYLYFWRKGYYKKKGRLRPFKIAIIELEPTSQTGYIAKFHDARIKRFKWWGAEDED